MDSPGVEPGDPPPGSAREARDEEARQQKEVNSMDEIVPETQQDEDVDEMPEAPREEPGPPDPTQRAGHPRPEPNGLDPREPAPAELKDTEMTRERAKTSLSLPEQETPVDKTAAEETLPMELETKPEATPHQLAAALTHSLQESSIRKPRLHGWLDLIQQLFGQVYPKSTIKKASMSVAAQRLPRLKKLEQERLVDLFEDIVLKKHQDWTIWRHLLEEACKTVYKTRQSLEYVLSKQLGKLAVQEAVDQAPVLTQWAQKITGREASTSRGGQTQKAFLFNQTVYSADETVHLRSICEKTYGKHTAVAFREGTETEWRIVQGLVEGTILCRRLPQFINRIMQTQYKLRIIGTFRAQVEGKLIMDLDGEMPIKEAFRSTKSLQESISTAATNRGEGGQTVWSMLAAVKTISYHAAKHEINFHFFTREEAKKFEAAEIPFHKHVHALVNAHAPLSISRTRQSGTDS